MEEKEKVLLAEDAESNLQEADKEDMDAMSEDIPDESPVEDTIEDDDEEDDDLTIKSEEFFDTTISDYDEFDEMAHKKGSGYKAPHFPIFDQKMEGLEAGLFMFAGESNMGKTGVALELAIDYALHEDNHLFCLYFSLDDTKKEVIPRIIASHESLPISIVSKPNRYQELIDSGDSMGPDYEEMLEKRTNGLEWLKSTNHHLKIVDGTQVSCGEQMLDYCEKMKAYIQAEDPDANLIVVIDSLSDIVFASKSFKSDKELNDYIAKQVKKWAVEILDCPIFGTVHLRKIEQNRRPTIADVKESGRYAYEASALFLVHNDVSRNKQAASICVRTEGSDELIPVIELDWAKNKKSSYKGRTYQTFVTNYSQVRECSREVCERFDRLIYNV